jgi:hypothetical protein
MEYLQSHIYNKKLYEVHFANELVLNVASVMNEKSEEICLTPRRVFHNGGSKEKSQLFSYYLFWHEDPQPITDFHAFMRPAQHLCPIRLSAGTRIA